MRTFTFTWMHKTYTVQSPAELLRVIAQIKRYGF